MQRKNPAGEAAASATEPEARAIASYHACLRDGLAGVTQEALWRAHQDHRLLVRDRPLCTVLRPRFLSARREEHLAAVSNILSSLFERAGEYLLASDTMLDLVGASDAEREIWAVDPGYPGFTLTSRLDSFMVGEDIRFVEYNAESPAGIGFCDRLTDVFNSLPAARAWRGSNAEAVSLGRFHLLEALLWAYAAWGGSGKPAIAVIDWDDVITKRDFELCAEYFRENGIQTVITDPRSLRYRDGKLWCGNEQITLVYRRVLLHELLDKADESKDLLDAYRDGAICMVNPARSKLLHKKTVFALLSDRALGLELSDAEEEVVEATIPWTRRLSRGKTQHHGQTVDLERLLLTRKDQLTIKPADDYGGRGVVLGWEVTSDEWEKAIESALDGDYVVQERVSVPEESYPVWQDGALAEIPLLLDTNPLLFRGSMGCVLTRLSGSALLNVTAGTGSAVPTFVLDQ